jgi:zinc/manganese transport system permease protein
LLSHFGHLPPGPAIVLAAGVLYAVSLFAAPFGGLIWLALPRRHLEA